MTQLALVYDAGTEGTTAWAERLEWLRRAVDLVGHKEVAYVLNVKPSNLTDALHERERKDIKAKWFDTVLRMVPQEMRAEYLRILCVPLGFDAPKPIRKRTTAEENREIRELLRTQAPAVLALVEKEFGK